MPHQALLGSWSHSRWYVRFLVSLYSILIPTPSTPMPSSSSKMLVPLLSPSTTHHFRVPPILLPKQPFLCQSRMPSHTQAIHSKYFSQHIFYTPCWSRHRSSFLPHLSPHRLQFLNRNLLQSRLGRSIPQYHHKIPLQHLYPYSPNHFPRHRPAKKHLY